MTNKHKYREFCKVEGDMPVFSKDWWLDSVCGEDNWDVVLIENFGEITASMPYYIYTKRDIFTFLNMPKLTQNLGPYIKYPTNQKYEKKLSYEKTVMFSLIEQLPKYDIFSQNFNYKITNWLPFYWKGYSQTTKYTYVIENLSNLEEIFSNFNRAKRKNIKRAEQLVTIKFDLSAIDFYNNHKMTLSKQNAKISYSFELFQNIYKNGYENNAAKTIYAVDENDNLHGALFIIWDDNSAYDLISTIDPDFRDSGAAALLVKEAIKYASSRTKKFDFEGSMIENVENSFRQFGAIQTAYFNISKTNSKILKIKKLIDEVRK